MARGRAAAHRAATIFVAAGVLSIALTLLELPTAEAGQALVGASVAGASFAVAALYHALPWERWPWWTPLVVNVPVLLGLPWWLRSQGYVGEQIYPLFIVVLYVWLGMSFPPRTSLLATPVAVAGYVLPLLTGHAGGEVWSALTVIPVCVLVGELLAHHLRRLEEAQDQSEHRAALLAAAAAAARQLTTLDPAAVLTGVLDVVCGDVVAFDAACVMVMADDHVTLEVLDGRNLPPGLPSAGFDVTGSVAGAALERDEVVVVDDYGADPRADPRVARLGFRTVAATPIRGDGDRDAVLVAASYRWQTVGVERREVLQLLASHAGAALANARRHVDQGARLEAATVASRRDELTGVGNRRRAVELLEAMRPGDALLMLDLDHFKEVNDTFGHQIGDGVLADLGAYLRATLRGADTIARYGGEEFVVVLRGAGQGAGAIAERLNAGWRTTEPLATLSIGLTVHGPEGDPMATLARADRSLYEAKEGGRDRVRAG